MNKLKENVILFLDSGIGGLEYLKFVKTYFNYNFVYLADNKNFPYGLKDFTTLRELIQNNILKISKLYSIKAVVLACNTASICIKEKNNIDLPLVFTMPDISLIDNFKSKNILILATKSSIESSYVGSYKRKYSNVHLLSATSLIEFIENKTALREAENFLWKLRKYIRDNNINLLYLACTHFLHIRTLLEDISNIDIYDSRALTLSQLINFNIESQKNSCFSILYTTSSLNFNFYKSLESKYNLKFSGALI